MSWSLRVGLLIFGLLLSSSGRSPFDRAPDGMIFIRGGLFQMGDVFGLGTEDEKPVHLVQVSSFFLHPLEVTNAQFVNFLNDEGNQLQGGTSWYAINDHRAVIYEVEGDFYVTEEYAEHPVSLVSWFGATAYCNWLSQEFGYAPAYTIRGDHLIIDWDADGYRLPTEAEWEYAARSEGLNIKWSGTSNAAGLALYANTDGQLDGYPETAPVGRLSPNSLGLYDMSANVWEWCWDWYDPLFYTYSLREDPIGPLRGSLRAIRGGGWDSDPASCYVANRSGNGPASRYHFIGFRLARSLQLEGAWKEE
ncbi:MAG: SUMF1/EgtB/PvdO family nonheme iron enzyme [Bacteroidota bacterium]